MTLIRKLNLYLSAVEKRTQQSAKMFFQSKSSGQETIKMARKGDKTKTMLCIDTLQIISTSRILLKVDFI